MVKRDRSVASSVRATGKELPEMDQNDERRERLKRAPARPEGRRSDPEAARPQDERRREESREGESAERSRGTLDRLIDQAQERGIFDKAERFVRDRFGDRGSGRSR
ncbi:hypothetical protein [Rubrobacter radiotolerans]|nr:hypothetical protein [Rubrobacter radiotolerans]